ncbi:hypothetical protein RN001_004536 [Aquatica leii]|uniref:Uncharacterized protein n=1 Tax=Aquatica leii TaxID=1421715 RepID=A0AAN7PAU3_9COLE|nr:hypothetical protein RN001_004536 [Aquatica leii]
MLEAFGGSVLKPLGVVPLKVQCNELEFIDNFIIVDKTVSPLLGLESCSKLKLIVRKKNFDSLVKFSTKDEFIKNNSELFECLGPYAPSEDSCDASYKPSDEDSDDSNNGPGYKQYSPPIQYNISSDDDTDENDEMANDVEYCLEDNVAHERNTPQPGTSNEEFGPVDGNHQDFAFIGQSGMRDELFAALTQTTEANGLVYLQVNLGSRNYTTSASNVRNEYAEYFSERGAVLWQLNMIHDDE